VLLENADRIGSITPGLAADLLVVKGDPATRIEEIEKPGLVFEGGVGSAHPAAPGVRPGPRLSPGRR